MQRALSVLPAGVKAYSSAIFEEDVTKKIDDIAKAKSISKRMAKKHALKEIINSTDQGMIVADIVALSGCVTELEIHCDNCKDARGCKMLRPEIAHTLPQDAMPACGECWGKRGVMCTFKRMSPELEQQLRTFASFRTHVPCYRCWNQGKRCDNSKDSCKGCHDAGVSCEREACFCYHEPRDDSFCALDCDKAHHDDGYDNVVHHARDEEGFNVQATMRQMARNKDQRKTICNSCFERGWDQTCTNDTTCTGCETRERNGEKVFCQRMKCSAFRTCTHKACTFAHANQGFAAMSLVDWSPGARLRDLRTLPIRHPFPDSGHNEDVISQ
jgi:hypothetical protein